MVMTRETRLAHYEVEHNDKIRRVTAILLDADMDQTLECLAEQIVDELHPPRWRDK